MRTREIGGQAAILPPFLRAAMRDTADHQMFLLHGCFLI